MAIDIAAMAASIVGSFLLPYVKAGADKIAEATTEKFGPAAAAHVKDLAGKVWNRVTQVLATPDDQKALDLFMKQPELMQKMIEEALRKKLSEDAALVKEFAAMLDAAVPDSHLTGAQIMNAGVAGIVNMPNADFGGASNVTISGVTLTSGSESIPIPPKPPEDKPES